MNNKQFAQAIRDFVNAVGSTIDDADHLAKLNLSTLPRDPREPDFDTEGGWGKPPAPAAPRVGSERIKKIARNAVANCEHNASWKRAKQIASEITRSGFIPPGKVVELDPDEWVGLLKRKVTALMKIVADNQHFPKLHIADEDRPTAKELSKELNAMAVEIESEEISAPLLHLSPAIKKPDDMLPASNYARRNIATPNALRKAADDGRLPSSEKLGGRWYHSESEVRKIWGEFFPK